MLGNTSDLMHDDRLLCGRQSLTANFSCGSSLASRFAKRAARNLSSELRMPVS
jgi:hypothetical protein